VKFLVDMPLPPALALWLRGQGHDATHALDLGLSRAPDVEIIARAATDKCTVITADLDYPDCWLSVTQSHRARYCSVDGIGRRSTVIETMADILRSLDAEEIAHSILVVDSERIRRRRLPIG
jgi:predicted nuclease of predicted toxin-antitoxin system